MRLLLLENGLTSRVNHHTTSAVGHHAEAQRRGIECVVYANREIGAENASRLRARPIFPDIAYGRRSRDPLCGDLEDAFFYGQRFAAACRMVGADGVSSDDIVLVPTARPAAMIGLGRWLPALAPDQRPRVVLNFHNDDVVSRDTRKLNQKAMIHRFAAKQLSAALPPERLLMTATNAKLAALLSEILPARVLAFPAPQFYDAEDREDEAGAPNGGRVRVSVLGGLRVDKGSFILADVLRRCASVNPRLALFAQANPGFTSDRLKTIARELEELGQALDFRVSAEALSARDYVRQLRRSDIVLCPYDASYFVARISGVFADAVAEGRPCVVPAGTWMADQLSEGHAAGVTFAEFTADAIADAVRRAASDLDALKTRAAACAPAWRREQCIGAYLDRMLAEFGARPA